ncbi:MAG: serine hydrolase [Lachnospiraceae bacterium]
MRRFRIERFPAAILLALCLTGCAAGESSSTAVTKVTGWETIPEEETNQKETTGTGEVPGEADAAQEEVLEASVAEETESPALEESTLEETEAADEETSSLENAAAQGTFSGTLASSSLAVTLQDVIAANGLNADNFSISYENLATGDSLYWNELTIMTPASTYKLPLNMYYYDAEARGEMSEDDTIPGVGLSLAECHYKSLVLSDNPSSEAMLANVSFSDFRQYVTRYFTLSSDEIGDTYWHRNFYCTRMMADIASYLYQNAGSYGDCIVYLKQAMPGMYFRRYITDCEIAQKYGRLNGWENCVGIVYGRTPFALCVYTYGQSEDLVAKIAKAVYDFEEAG